jgi:hypothetical protein
MNTFIGRRQETRNGSYGLDSGQLVLTNIRFHLVEILVFGHA